MKYSDHGEGWCGKIDFLACFEEFCLALSYLWLFAALLEFTVKLYSNYCVISTVCS